ncbi:hypothetical protein CYMTET_21438 [Cymbomonas tetramitiformis]|uniref:Mediator of RNA polymerase II transcription subunit 13 n=1 Tax=Cymbomonas tetramitiformis TaxID=36881 RepID=A0AAE0G208_9CHLO|nr:hypothetical protein CYMTET_21438 [Cymbomonas tetramitiformis]
MATDEAGNLLIKLPHTLRCCSETDASPSSVVHMRHLAQNILLSDHHQVTRFEGPKVLILPPYSEVSEKQAKEKTANSELDFGELAEDSEILIEHQRWCNALEAVRQSGTYVFQGSFPSPLATSAHPAAEVSEDCAPSVKDPPPLGEKMVFNARTPASSDIAGEVEQHCPSTYASRVTPPSQNALLASLAPYAPSSLPASDGRASTLNLPVTTGTQESQGSQGSAGVGGDTSSTPSAPGEEGGAGAARPLECLLAIARLEGVWCLLVQQALGCHDPYLELLLTLCQPAAPQHPSPAPSLGSHEGAAEAAPDSKRRKLSSSAEEGEGLTAQPEPSAAARRYDRPCRRAPHVPERRLALSDDVPRRVALELIANCLKPPLLKVKDTVIGGDHWGTLPVPSVVVGYQDDWLVTSLSTVVIWEKTPLEPYAPRKAVSYYAICPEGMTDCTTDFFSQLSVMYSACRLGSHKAAVAGGAGDAAGGAGASSPWLVEVAPSATRDGCCGGGGQLNYEDALKKLTETIRHRHPPHALIVVYLVAPFASPGSAMCSLLQACLDLGRASPALPAGAYDHPDGLSMQDSKRSLTLQTVPMEMVLAGAHTCPPRHMRALAFSVFSKVRHLRTQPASAQAVWARGDARPAASGAAPPQQLQTCHEPLMVLGAPPAPFSGGGAASPATPMLVQSPPLSPHSPARPLRSPRSPAPPPAHASPLGGASAVGGSSAPAPVQRPATSAVAAAQAAAAAALARPAPRPLPPQRLPFYTEPGGDVVFAPSSGAGAHSMSQRGDASQAPGGASSSKGAGGFGPRSPLQRPSPLGLPPLQRAGYRHGEPLEAYPGGAPQGMAGRIMAEAEEDQELHMCYAPLETCTGRFLGIVRVWTDARGELLEADLDLAFSTSSKSASRHDEAAMQSLGADEAAAQLLAGRETEASLNSEWHACVARALQQGVFLRNAGRRHAPTPANSAPPPPLVVARLGGFTPGELRAWHSMLIGQLSAILLRGGGGAESTAPGSEENADSCSSQREARGEDLDQGPGCSGAEDARWRQPIDWAQLGDVELVGVREGALCEPGEERGATGAASRSQHMEDGVSVASSSQIRYGRLPDRGDTVFIITGNTGPAAVEDFFDSGAAQGRLLEVTPEAAFPGRAASEERPRPAGCEAGEGHGAGSTSKIPLTTDTAAHGTPDAANTAQTVTSGEPPGSKDTIRAQATTSHQAPFSRQRASQVAEQFYKFSVLGHSSGSLLPMHCAVARRLCRILGQLATLAPTDDAWH